MSQKNCDWDHRGKMEHTFITLPFKIRNGMTRTITFERLFFADSFGVGKNN